MYVCECMCVSVCGCVCVHVLFCAYVNLMCVGAVLCMSIKCIAKKYAHVVRWSLYFYIFIYL